MVSAYEWHGPCTHTDYADAMARPVSRSTGLTALCVARGSDMAPRCIPTARIPDVVHVRCGLQRARRVQRGPVDALDCGLPRALLEHCELLRAQCSAQFQQVARGERADGFGYVVVNVVSRCSRPRGCAVIVVHRLGLIWSRWCAGYLPWRLHWQLVQRLGRACLAPC